MRGPLGRKEESDCKSSVSLENACVVASTFFHCTNCGGMDLPIEGSVSRIWILSRAEGREGTFKGSVDLQAVHIVHLGRRY